MSAPQLADTLPPGLGQAFRVAVAELGLCSASWLFVTEVYEAGGEPLLERLRDAFGRDWPVLDTVAALHLAGKRRSQPDVSALVQACGPAGRIVCVGLEADHLDALASATTIPISLVRQSVFSPDWERVEANYEGRIAIEPVETFQRLAGPRSVLLTFVYGSGDERTHVLPSWVRLYGDDVRTQFRSLIAWEVLNRPFFVYPRWLLEAPLATFSEIVRT